MAQGCRSSSPRKGRWWSASRYLSYTPPAYERGTRPFLGGSGRRAEAQTRPTIPKMSQAPSVFPFLGRLRRQAINLNPPRRVKAWGTPPWGQSYILWWDTPDRTVQHAARLAKARPTNWTEFAAKKKILKRARCSACVLTTVLLKYYYINFFIDVY